MFLYVLCNTLYESVRVSCRIVKFVYGLYVLDMVYMFGYGLYVFWKWINYTTLYMVYMFLIWIKRHPLSPATLLRGGFMPSIIDMVRHNGRHNPPLSRYGPP